MAVKSHAPWSLYYNSLDATRLFDCCLKKMPSSGHLVVFQFPVVHSFVVPSCPRYALDTGRRVVNGLLRVLPRPIRAAVFHDEVLYILTLFLRAPTVVHRTG